MALEPSEHDLRRSLRRERFHAVVLAGGWEIGPLRKVWGRGSAVRTADKKTKPLATRVQDLTRDARLPPRPALPASRQKETRAAQDLTRAPRPPPRPALPAARFSLPAEPHPFGTNGVAPLGGVPSGVYPIHIGQCGGKPPADDVYTACRSGDTLWLGQNVDVRKSHNVQWKFVIAHEIGHLILAKFNASPNRSAADAYKAVVAEPICECEHILELDDKAHCIQSKEYLADAQAEGLAHMIAANTWNPLDENECKFVYYKSVRTIFTRTAPVLIDCPPRMATLHVARPRDQKSKWLETWCLQPSRGVELDWMNWMHAVNVAPVAQRSTVEDVAKIFARACGGNCAFKEPTPEALIEAMKLEYSDPNDLRRPVFTAAINEYGANH